MRPVRRSWRQIAILPRSTASFSCALTSLERARRVVGLGVVHHDAEGAVGRAARPVLHLPLRVDPARLAVGVDDAVALRVAAGARASSRRRPCARGPRDGCARSRPRTSACRRPDRGPRSRTRAGPSGPSPDGIARSQMPRRPNSCAVSSSSLLARCARRQRSASRVTSVRVQSDAGRRRAPNARRPRTRSPAAAAQLQSRPLSAPCELSMRANERRALASRPRPGA